MWLAFGLAAIVFTGIHLVLFFSNKPCKLFMALGLAFTALTLCAEYAQIASWAATQDWSAIEDVAPTMSRALWVLTGASVVMNLTPVIVDAFRKK